MEYRKETNGLQTFLEQWWFIGMALTAIASNLVLEFFGDLSDRRWIYCGVAATVLQLFGAALIAVAKFPLYREKRFFTFGSKSISPALKRYYRWGWVVFLGGVALSVCLLLSKTV